MGFAKLVLHIHYYSTATFMNQVDFEALRLLQNNIPVEDFCGLTSTEMHRLLYDPFGDSSPLRFHSELSDETLDQIPYFCLTEELLRIIQQNNGLKLTQKGALSEKTTYDLYNFKHIPEYWIENGVRKLKRERDSASLTTLRVAINLTGLVKQSKGKFVLTKKGETLLHPKQRQKLFKAIISTYIDKFNWGFLDLYPESIGQFGWGFTIYLLHKYGDTEHPLQFYVDKHLKAFPGNLDAFSHKIFNPPERFFTSCYRSRTFERFLRWFGFVTMPLTDGVFGESNMIKRTDTMKKVFTFD